MIKGKYTCWKVLRKIYYSVINIIEMFLNNILQSPVKIVLNIRNPELIYKDYKNIIKGQKLYPVIRLGSETDGGYWVPDDLTGIEACFSPGYGGTKTFEDHLSKLGIRSYICDPTYNEVEDLLKDQQFRNISLAGTSNKKGKKISLTDWIQLEGFQAAKNLMLQMDIEGAEYDILNCTNTELLFQFKIVIIEFHHLDMFFVSNIFSDVFAQCMEKLKLNHTLVNINVNNAGGYTRYKFKKFPKVIEMSFLRTDSFTAKEFATSDNLSNRTSVNHLGTKSLRFPVL